MKNLALMAMLVTLMLAFNTKAVMAQEKAKPEKAKTAPAQEKAKLGPVVKVLLENEKVKVQEVMFKPGAKSEMKERPDTVIYVLKGAKLKRYSPDGKTEDIERKTGSAFYNKRETRSAENITRTDYRIITIQIK
jgi:quercetin dioxygenase-like cupin family protein